MRVEPAQRILSISLLDVPLLLTSKLVQVNQQVPCAERNGYLAHRPEQGCPQRAFLRTRKGQRQHVFFSVDNFMALFLPKLEKRREM